MTKVQLMDSLKTLQIGQKIPGAISGKTYYFSGIQKYSGLGRFAHLNGQDVIVLHSNERKRSKIILFVEPLYLLVNSSIEELGYGHLPSGYIMKCMADDTQGIPNLYEYESHYKCLARYLRNFSQTPS